MTEQQPPHDPTTGGPFGGPPPPPPYGQQPPYPQQPYQQPYQQPFPQPPYGYTPPTPPPPTDGLALASMIIGIVSLVLACGYGIGLLGSPAALIMGRIATKRIDASGGALDGRGFAQAGFILGIVGTVLLVVAIVLVVIIIVAVANGSFDSSGSYRY